MYDWGGLVTPNAVFRSTQPRLNWAVIDMNFEELRVGLAPIKRLEQPGFIVSIYNFELMQAAVQRVAENSQGFRLRRLKGDLRADFAREVTALGDSLEHSACASTRSARGAGPGRAEQRARNPDAIAPASRAARRPEQSRRAVAGLPEPLTGRGADPAGILPARQPIAIIATARTLARHSLYR
jgi:hypothetical protein